MGGTIACLAACNLGAEVKTAVSFYGSGIATDVPMAPLNVKAELQGLILCLFGENDPYITTAQVRKIEETLRSLGKTYEIKVCAGADRGLFCDERERLMRNRRWTRGRE